ncbi:MAG: sugar isomerase domain-containing protein [Candidatus Bipolaricaulia bacterium]
MSSPLAKQYFERVLDILQEVQRTQMERIQQAARLIADTIAREGIVHIFGAGHSHLLAEEVFFRAGGLAPVNAILEPSLMLHAGALKSTAIEKISQYATVLLEYHDVRPGDVLIIISNSGVNSVPVELAIQARAQKVTTIGLTCIAYSQQLQPNNPAGKRLYEVVDLVIDNGGVPGDAILKGPGLEPGVGPTSTVVGATILNALMAEAIQDLWARGIEPPVFLSSHLDGAAEHNARLAQRYRERIRSL